VNGFPQRGVVGSHSPPQEVKATQGQKPVHYCMKKPATASHKNRQDATDPTKKAIRDYKEQVDRNTPYNGKLKTGEPTKPQWT